MPYASGKTHTKLFAGATLMCLALAAQGQSSQLVGGGSTLTAFGYAGDPTNRLMTPDAGSLLAAYDAITGANTTYCRTGGPAGKRVFTVASGNNANLACTAPIPPASATGFGGSALAQPHYASTDVALDGADYSNYVAAHVASGSQPVQIPALAATVAVVFNHPQVRELRLSEEQLCRIFSGDISTWQDSRLQSAIVRRVAPVAPTGNITMVYANDSDASFALSNHLSAKCGTLTSGHGFPFGGIGVATGFSTQKDFVFAAFNYIPVYASSIAIGAGQDTDMINAVLSNSGSFGYASTPMALQAGVQVASIRNDGDTLPSDPSDFGAPLSVPLTLDRLLGPLEPGGRPSIALTPIQPATAGCVALVDPAAYAVPLHGYPILSVSYLLANSRGNGADVGHVRALVLAPYDPVIRGNSPLLGPATGESFLTAPAINASMVAGCIL